MVLERSFEDYLSTKLVTFPGLTCSSCAVQLKTDCRNISSEFIFLNVHSVQ